MKRNLKKTISLLFVGIILGVSIMAVFASTTYASGIYSYYGPQLGYSYKNQSTVTSDTTWGCFADTIAKTQDWSYVPVGYIGCMARLYNSAGDLKKITDWDYNYEETNIWSASTDWIQISGTYQSDGLTRAWNGTGYYTYDSYPSPYLQHVQE